MSSAQLHSHPNSSQGGQGILEVIVTIGIGTIMILALVVLSVRTNRSSDFSKASSQASSLASEGIEIINNLKKINGTDGATKLFKLDSNCSGNILGTQGWDELFGAGMDIPDESCGSFGRIGYIVDACSPSGYSCVYFSDNASTSRSVTVDTRTYTREVFIADTPAPSVGTGKSNCNTDANPVTGDWRTIKQFSVVVSWSDSSGTHNQTQTSCIGR